MERTCDYDPEVPAGEYAIDPPRTPDEEDEDDDTPEGIEFCELCGCSGEDDEEMLRCEECGRLHCSGCRAYDAEGSPCCIECFDEMTEE